MSDETYQPDTQPHNLRDRIAAVQAEHVERQLTNYLAEREKCGCGHQGNATYREHLADAVVDLLIDMAGHGELLKAIDKMHRKPQFDIQEFNNKLIASWVKSGVLHTDYMDSTRIDNPLAKLTRFLETTISALDAMGDDDKESPA